MHPEDTNSLNKPRNKSKHNTNEFPTVITALPQADIQAKGIKAWIVQAEKHQLIFFEMQPDAIVPEHSHSYPQWGMLIEGKMKLTINGKTKTIKKGDEYLIPRQAKHHATPDLFGGGYPPYEPPNPTSLRKPIPEQAKADAAHFYSAKEEGPPYRTKE